MTEIKVKSKEELMDKVRKYRKDGYMLITFGYSLCELEKGDEIVVLKV